MSGAAEQTGQMKVFVSYSRDDVAFADQLVAGLEHSGFEPILDRHAIDAAENWRERLGKLILSADAVAFVLTERSASSPICAWEVEEAQRLGKRIVPVAPREVTVAPPQALADLNWIHFFPTPAIPGSGMLDGMRKLDRALRVDLAWLREQTRLSERATEWAATGAEDRLLRGAALREAQAWLDHAPKDASVPARVRDYLTASADAEQGRESAARAQLEEKQKALDDAQAAIASERTAIADKAKTTALLRWVSIGALIVGVALATVAGWGLWYASTKTIEAADRRADLFAQASHAATSERDPVLASMLAIAGESENGFEAMLKPGGHPALAVALARANSENHLLTRTDLSEKLGVATIPLKIMDVPGTNRFMILWAVREGDEALSRITVMEAGKAEPLATYKLAKFVTDFFPLADEDRVVITRQESLKIDLLLAGCVWSLKQGKCIRVFAGDEDWFAAGLGGTTAYKRELPGIEDRDSLREVAVEASGQRALTFNYDRHLRLWALGQQEAPVSVSKLELDSTMCGLLIDPEDATRAASWDCGSDIVFWKLPEPGKSGPMEIATTVTLDTDKDGITGIFWDPESGRSTLEVIGERGLRSVRLYDGEPEPDVQYESPNINPFTTGEGDDRRLNIRRMALSPNGRRALAFTDDGVATPKLINTSAPEVDLNVFDREAFNLAAFIPGTGVVVTVTSFGVVKVWSHPAATRTDSLYEEDPTGRSNFQPIWMALGGGRGIVVGSPKRTRIWQDGKVTPSPRWEGLQVLGETASDDGTLAWGPVAVDKGKEAIAIWRVGQEKPIHVLPPPDGRRIFFQPGGAAFLSQHAIKTTSKAAGFVISAWQTGKQDAPIGEIERIGRFQQTDFAADGVHVAISFVDEDGRGRLEVWRLGGKQPEFVRTLDDGVYSGVFAVKFTPDNASIAVSTRLGAIRVFALKDGAEQQTYLSGQNETIKTIRFSRDGRIIQATDGKFAMVWLAGQAVPAQVINLDADGENEVDLDPDGKFVITANIAHITRHDIDPLLFAKPTDGARTACERARSLGFAGFTADDRRRYPILAGVPDNPCIARGLIAPTPPAASPSPAK